MTVTIYHNPTCGTSRNVLALIRNSGEVPRVIEYLGPVFNSDIATI
jgi:arsenate reductase